MSRLSLAAQSASLLLLLTPVLAAGPVSKAAGNADQQRTVRVHNAGKSVGEAPPNMVHVPGGTFRMGIDEKMLRELGKGDNARDLEVLICMYPDHDEIVTGMYVDQYEVTNIQYLRFLELTGREPNEELAKLWWMEWKAGQQVTGKIPTGKEKHPIHVISFYEAMDCARLMGKRLPTETEWEYFARRSIPNNQLWPWGEAWDKANCCNSSNSSSSNGPEPQLGGSFEADVTPEGVHDVAGNLMEWTITSFEPYPGYEPLDFRKRPRGKVTIHGKFDSLTKSIRGGNYIGNEVSNTLATRWGCNPNSILEGIGFRCVLSDMAGLDQVKYSGTTDLALLSGDIKSRVAYQPETFAGQTLHYSDQETGVVTGSDHLVLASAEKVTLSMARLEKESIEAPELVAVLTTSKDLLVPELSAGSYAVYYKGAGESKAQRQARLKREEAEAKKKAEKEAEEAAKKGRSRRGSRSKDDKKDEKKDEKAEEAEKGEGEQEGELTEEEKKAQEEQEGLAEEVEEIGAEAEVDELIDYPTDIDLFLLKNNAGKTVGWLPANTDQVRMAPTTISYEPGAASGDPTSEAVVRGGTAAKPEGTPVGGDLATFQFSLKTAASTRYPRFSMKLVCAPGSFDPVAPIDGDADDKAKASSRGSRRR